MNQSLEPRKVPIELDKIRHILVDFNALALYEEATGKSALRGEFNSRSAKEVRAMLWSFLVHEDPNLTIHDVGRMLNVNSFERVLRALNEALEEALNDGDTPQGNGVAAKSRRTGATTGQ